MKKLIGIVVAFAIVFAMLPVAAFAATNYYVAGQSELCGSSWKENDASNIMTANGDVYTKTYSNVAVGTYEFKITDGTWNNSWGDNGGNYKFAVTTAGDITITFNATSKEISVSGTGVGEAKMEINYVTAVGAGENGFLNNVQWDPTADSNKMTEANGVYTISYENVSAGTYKYKFAANGQWTDDWGYSGETASGVTVDAAYKGGDASVTVAEDGSTVTLTLDLSGIDNKGNGAKITATVEAPKAEEGGETSGNVLASVTDEAVTATAPWTYTFTAESTGVLNVKVSSNVAFKIYGLTGPNSESLRLTANSWSAGTDSDHNVTVPGEITVKVWCWGGSAVGETSGDISCTLTFTPDEGEQEVVKEDYVLSGTKVYLGQNTLTLNENAIFTIYEFCPDESGVYKFTVNNAMACVGYAGAGSYYYYAPTGDLINSFEYELPNAGPSIMVGISDVEGEFTLTIEKVGDVVVKEVVWVEYENMELEYVADMEFFGNVVALDVTDPDLADKIFMDSDGLFRYGSPTGPIIVSMVNDNAYISFAELLGNGAMRLPEYDDEGDLIGGLDFSNAMWEYIYAGNVPMTFELVMMVASYGAKEGVGWYDEDVLGNYLFSEEVNPDTAWLCFFGYAEGTEMEQTKLDTVIEGENEFADYDEAWMGDYVTIAPEADGVVTVEVTASNPGYMIYISGYDAEGYIVDLDPWYYEGEGTTLFTFDVVEGGLYTVNLCTGAYDEEYEYYDYAAGSISYVVTYAAEAVGPQDPDNPDEPDEPVVSDAKYYVTGEGDLFGNWAADNAAGVMTESADGVYKFTLENVPAGDYKFKVTNGTWDECWGDPNSGDPDGNYLFSVTEVSDVTITFNSTTGEIAVAVNGEDIPKTADMSIAAVAFALMAATAGAVVIGKKKEF